MIHEAKASGPYLTAALSARTTQVIPLLNTALHHTNDAITTLHPCYHQPTWPTGPLTNEHQARTIHTAITTYRRDTAQAGQWICLCPQADHRTLIRLATHWLTLWQHCVRYVTYPDRYSLRLTRRAAALVDDHAAWVITHDPAHLLGTHPTTSTGADQ
ncbi:hypothetical protein [Rugosimonospora africana]|uniref:Uncharacterized protein n=1 Tax=Rugosimonospora africana TaxID=556532 RepID=A0A8J3VW80_9ACTN|nr:hypothetical protein [Rugosimonospora africana]GIH20679.1 hypothetical protein Raf01_88510 [Rugosimonospora africana]